MTFDLPSDEFKLTSASSAESDFEPGEWDRLLSEAEESGEMSFDEATNQRPADRAIATRQT